MPMGQSCRFSRHLIDTAARDDNRKDICLMLCGMAQGQE
jgi:hypothetical protein